MYKNKKIGVGLITYNRKQDFLNLLESISKIDYIDEISIVKNKEIDYGQIQIPQNGNFINIKEDIGVGYCKNCALQYLMKNNCEYLFLIEDDTIIKNQDVFKKYIDTAEFFHLEHLVFGYGSSGNKPNEFDEKVVTPHTILKVGENYIDFYFHLQGAFVFFTRNIIEKVGLFDDIHYINALEHVEHTYRICKYQAYSPFWAFADIHDSTQYLGWLHEDKKYSSTIEQKNDLYNKRLHDAYSHFREVYNININQIQPPSKQEISEFIGKKIKNG